MSNTANKTLIGAFVLGAIALLVVAVAVIGSGQLFSTPLRFVMFFDSSLKGLSAGSPVVFRGVPIGRVSAIRMAANLDTMQFRIPVYIEVDKITTQDVNHPARHLYENPEYLRKMVNNGLRARLNNQSLLTGQLLIELDFFPSRSYEGTPSPTVTVYEGLSVIPTIPSQLDTVWQRIAELPVDQFMQHLARITEKIDNLLDAPGLQTLSIDITRTLAEARIAMKTLDSAMISFEKLSHSMTDLTSTLDKQAPETLARTRTMIESYTKLAGQLDRSLESLRGVVGPNTITVLEFNRAVHEITDAARAMRSLANLLERNPESLLLGKGAKH